MYGLQDGMDIRDESIQEYYCIQCIRGKIKAKGGKFLIPDWKSLVQKFKWDGWDPGEKEEILRNNDRDKCVELGFKYNQYFAFKIRREDGTEIYFELIANRETQIASEKELFHVTHSLMETYSPLVNLLWDISDASGERS